MADKMHSAAALSDCRAEWQSVRDQPNLENGCVHQDGQALALLWAHAGQLIKAAALERAPRLSLPVCLRLSLLSKGSSCQSLGAQRACPCSAYTDCRGASLLSATYSALGPSQKPARGINSSLHAPLSRLLKPLHRPSVQDFELSLLLTCSLHTSGRSLRDPCRPGVSSSGWICRKEAMRLRWLSR